MNPFTHVKSFETTGFYICSIVYVSEALEEYWSVTAHKHIFFFTRSSFCWS